MAVYCNHSDFHALKKRKKAKGGKKWGNGRKEERGKKGKEREKEIRKAIDLTHLSSVSLRVNNGILAAEEFFDDLQPRRTLNPCR